MKPCRIHLVAGARPNVMKIAPLHRVLSRQAWCEPRIVFIGQHYSENMSQDLFAQFGVHDAITAVPLEPGSYGERMGRIISAYSDILAADQPDMVVVPGDVDVALGAALATRRQNRTLAHLEAGLRSYDASMPEEMNRILIDSIADILLAPSEAAAQNLIYHEGADHRRVHFVGNIMIDSLAMVLSEAHAGEVAGRFGVAAGGYAVATFHRPGNVDDPARLAEICGLVEHIAARTPVVFPIHPRTLEQLERSEAGKAMLAGGRVKTCPPLGYTDFANLVSRARLVVTDSGGIQEETSWLNVPCFTLRDSTERPITVSLGTNTLVNFDDVREQVDHALTGDAPRQKGALPLWDGRTAWRVAQVLRGAWDRREA